MPSPRLAWPSASSVAYLIPLAAGPLPLWATPGSPGVHCYPTTCWPLPLPRRRRIDGIQQLLALEGRARCSMRPCVGWDAVAPELGLLQRASTCSRRLQICQTAPVRPYRHHQGLEPCRADISDREPTQDGYVLVSEINMARGMDVRRDQRNVAPSVPTSKHLQLTQLVVQSIPLVNGVCHRVIRAPGLCAIWAGTSPIRLGYTRAGCPHHPLEN